MMVFGVDFAQKFEDMLAREREMTVEEEVVVLTDGNPFCIVKCQLIKEWVSVQAEIEPEQMHLRGKIWKVTRLRGQ